MRRMIVAAVLLFPWAVAAGDEPAAPVGPPFVPPLTDETFETVRDQILPCAEECEFENAGWRTSFGAAVEEASRSGKPVLLWAMNGHPLGCT